MAGRKLLVWGAGGHGKVVADVARAAGWDVVGFVDRDPTRLGTVAEPGGARVAFVEEALLRRGAGNVLDIGADALALAVGANGAREACLIRTGGIETPAIVHPSAVVSPSARLGAATVVFPLAVVNAAAEVGEAAILNTASVVEHDCVLGRAVHLSPGAVVAGGVRVGDRSWIGAGATVIEGIRVGADVIVGAGAVVVRDVPDGVTVVGVPARPIRTV